MTIIAWQPLSKLLFIFVSVKGNSQFIIQNVVFKTTLLCWLQSTTYFQSCDLICDLLLSHYRPHVFYPGESEWEVRVWHLVSKVCSMKYSFCSVPLKSTPTVIMSLCVCVCLCAAVRWRKWVTTQWSEPEGCRGNLLTRTLLDSSEVSTLPSMLLLCHVINSILIYGGLCGGAWWYIVCVSVCCIEEELHCVLMLRGGGTEKLLFVLSVKNTETWRCRDTNTTWATDTSR